MWDDEQIDAAIDETARQMTAGEPGADFRARVMERIDGSRLGASFAIRPCRPALAGLVVAALIVIAFAVSRGTRQPASRVASAPATTIREEPDARSMVRLKPDPTYEMDVTPRPNVGNEVAQGFSPAIAANSVLVRRPDPAYDIEPLTTVALELESIAVTALTGSDPIDIQPLPPAPSIAVTPLDVENQGDRR